MCVCVCDQLALSKALDSGGTDLGECACVYACVMKRNHKKVHTYRVSSGKCRYLVASVPVTTPSVRSYLCNRFRL